MFVFIIFVAVIVLSHYDLSLQFCLISQKTSTVLLSSGFTVNLNERFINVINWHNGLKNDLLLCVSFSIYKNMRCLSLKITFV